MFPSLYLGIIIIWTGLPSQGWEGEHTSEG